MTATMLILHRPLRWSDREPLLRMVLKADTRPALDIDFDELLRPAS
jgi:hypothetical protein